MAVNRPYHEQIDIRNTKKLRELEATLPPFLFYFFRGIEPNTSSRTRIAYAYDLRVFFDYLVENHPFFKGKDVRSLEVSSLENVKPIDLEAYMDYLKYYTSEDGEEHINHARGLMRKISAIKTMYNYFYQKEMVESNPAARIPLPKIPQKEIIRLDIDEVAELLDQVESGEKLSEKQQAFHEKTKNRDLAMLSLLLGTGIRVSECVGLDIKDVDFQNMGVHVHRKGGKEAIVYFSDEVADALEVYYDERKTLVPRAGYEDAFFLSLQMRRINVCSVENLVKKYAMTVTTLKKITPHKLRSTYGTSLYQETNDIYLVASVLGHSDVNTTKKHYAATNDYMLRSQRNAVKLREKLPDKDDGSAPEPEAASKKDDPDNKTDE